jgi:outer membrane protein assembly factor BamB
MIVLWGTGGAEATGPSPGRSGHDWPAFLGPTGDAVSGETGIRTDWSEGLPLVWERRLGEGYSMGSVSAGRFFLFDGARGEARLTALDAATGRELWRSTHPSTYEDYYGYSTGPRASPVVDGDRVYTYGVEGRLRCLRVDDGSLVWEVDTTARFGVVQNFFGSGSSPVIEGDLLVAMVGGSPPDSPRIHTGEVEGNGTGLVAFDKRTGEVRWTLSDELASYSTPRVVTMHGRRRGFAFTRGGLLGFDPARGSEDFFFPWRARKLESVNASSPVVVDDTVLISESYGPGGVLLRVPPSGEPAVVWRDGRRNQSLRTHWSTPVYHEGFVYASSGPGSGNAELRCIDHRTGEVKWAEPGLARSTLLLVDGHLVVLTEYGKLLLVRPTPERFDRLATFVPLDERGRPLLSRPAWNAPVLAHGLLYVRGKDRLLALELIPPATGGPTPNR